MAVDINTNGAALQPGTPRLLFQTNMFIPSASLAGDRQYDVSADGSRFLIVSRADETAPTPVTVVLNWTATLKK